MSHLRVKTKYKTPEYYPGGYTQKEVTLYAHHNLGCDCTTFFDENGAVILAIEQDTDENTIIDAINRLWRPFKKNEVTGNLDILNDGVENMDKDDQVKCGIW